MISFRTLQIGCLWILSDIYFGYLPKIFIFCHYLLSYQTLTKKKLFFGLYRTKTSDVFQKFSSFKYHCLLSYRTLKKVVFRIVLDKNFGYLPKIFIFKCHCLLSSRTLTISCFLDCIGQKLRTSSKYICLLRATVCFFYRTVKISCCLWIVSYGNATKWQYFLPPFLDVRQAEPRETPMWFNVMLVYSHSVLSFQFPVHNQSFFFWHGVMLYFLIFLFFCTLLSVVSFAVLQRPCQYCLVISFTLHTRQ